MRKYSRGCPPVTPVSPSTQECSKSVPVPVNPRLEASLRQKWHQEDVFESKNASGRAKSKQNGAGRQQVSSKEAGQTTFDHQPMDQETQEARGEAGTSQQQVEYGDAINLFGVIDRDK